MSYARSANRPGYSRYLTALKAAGAVIDADMIILPRGASDSMRFDAELVCSRNAKYDWKHAEDVA